MPISEVRCLEDVARHLTRRGTRRTVVDRTVTAVVAGSMTIATAIMASTTMRVALTSRVSRISKTIDTRQSLCHHLSSSRGRSPASLHRSPSSSRHDSLLNNSLPVSPHSSRRHRSRRRRSSHLSSLIISSSSRNHQCSSRNHQCSSKSPPLHSSHSQ